MCCWSGGREEIWILAGWGGGRLFGRILGNMLISAHSRGCCETVLRPEAGCRSARACTPHCKV